MRVAVIANGAKDKDYANTKRLCEILAQKGIDINMSENMRGIVDGACCGDEELYDGVDAAIVLGGDGTVLASAVPCARRGIPIMGINLGRLGFMTETETKDIERAASRLKAGDYRIEERMMMEVTVGGSTFLALNDCVVSKESAQMIMAGVFAGEDEICEYIADGVIIATPTGSTGYSLSAGGPVAEPTMDMFLATPICAHSLKARPAVLAPDKKIYVHLFDGAAELADVTVDGTVRARLKTGERCEIVRANECLRLIKFGGQSFYDILTAKLV